MTQANEETKEENKNENKNENNKSCNMSGIKRSYSNSVCSHIFVEKKNDFVNGVKCICKENIMFGHVLFRCSKCNLVFCNQCHQTFVGYHKKNENENGNKIDDHDEPPNKKRRIAV